MASATPSASATALPAYPSTPDYPDDLEFITAYLTVHVLSDASRIYSYIFWIALAVVLVFFSLLHHLHLRGGYLGALWSKWTVRRRTWRKKHSLAIAKAKGQPHRQPFSFPSNAQIFTLVAIVVAALALSFAGPDYIAPGSTLWTLQDFPSATSTNIAKRAYDTSLFAQYQPHYTINKAWWTSGNRTGLIAFALFPLCILFALKSPPFAIFSLPCLVQIYCDKLLWLHKWTARLIYLLTVLHVAFWSVQLCIERRPSTGKIAYVYAWQYEKFLFAWIAFGCMTLLFLLSIAPIRRAHYEAFWFLHVLLVPLTLIMSALHHPPVWWWCWAALGLWFGERTWRFTWWLYTNGFFSSKAAGASVPSSNSPPGFPGLDQKVESPYPPKFKGSPPETPPSSSTLGFTHYPPISSVKLMPGAGLSLPTDYVPPPGFAHAELLPGRTVRLRIVTPGYLTWAPGQHFLISVPSITRFTTHPFTAASICDEQNPRGDGRVLVFIIRAKSGWTKDLWDTVALMIGRGQQFQRGEALPRCAMPSRGVLLRACVDGPYGSSVRARWNDYSSVVVVAGGSGVSYALSVLQYLCLCLAGRDGRFLGGKSGGYGQPGFKISRVRFVWLVREFGHVQWCASVLRRCMDLVPSPELQVDIFVTNVKPTPETGPSPPRTRISFAPLPKGKREELERPNPGFAQESRPQSRASNASSEESAEDSDVDLSYYTGEFGEEQGELGHEEHVLDLTNFEGDDDSELPGEAQFNLSVRREGRMRRRNTRRISMALLAKQELIYRSSEAFDGAAPASSSAQLVSKRASLPPIDTTNPRASQRQSVDIAAIHPSALSTPSPRTAITPPTPNSSLPLVDTSPKRSSESSSPHRSTRNLSLSIPGAGPSGPSAAASKRLSATLSERSLETPMTARSRLSQWTDTDSFAALVPGGDVERVREQLRLDLDDQEVEDVGIVAEHARPGKPRLDRILADEVERAKGAVAVACCGPTSLDAMMRKLIATQINPDRIRKGDMRGSIALFSEEFAY
ncbi:hypothetical protein PYCCODRAFT_1373773 [Trametes coccinea BRFM310]|uniref:ferric-chelate reductase (NADPH) n=1 Tax=Trametes coccinea (strain BRFM310) TaxID=1353009 RepID=A0A1Y2IFL0_TRAC3|nr:hypothetical protein PYCCODRAFT_1373773 [Trametes coccinea BRFM310]